MKTTNIFPEWFKYFDAEDLELIHQMYMAIRDGNSYEPFHVEVDGEKIFISCSTNSEIRLLIASVKARNCFFAQLREWAGYDIELKYEMNH